MAVEEINAMTLRHGLEGVVALGRWVLETFFGGDSERFEVERGSQPTWRALGRHPALGVSTTELWYAVRIVEQLDELPRRIGRALTPSHHRLLLTVEERRTKRRLARAAVEGGWGVRELAAEIGALSPATPQGEVAGVRLGRRVRSLHREALAFEADSEVKLSLAMAAAEQRWGARRLADEIAALTPEADKDPVAIATAGMTQMERSTREIAAASDATLRALPPEERRWLREALRHGIEEVEAVTAWLAWDARGS